MPIIMNQLDDDMQQLAQTNAKTYSPKFFDKKLTGKGGNAPGLLSIRNNPPSVQPAKTSIQHFHDYSKPSVYTRGNNTVYKIPVNTLHPNVMNTLDRTFAKDVAQLTKIGETQSAEIYAKLNITTFTLDETLEIDPYSGMSKKKTDFTPAYYLRLYVLQKNNVSDEEFLKIPNFRNLPYRKENSFSDIKTINPIEDWNQYIKHDLVNNGATCDDKAFMDYMINYEVYDDTVEKAEIWTEHMDDIINDILRCFKNQSTPMNTAVERMTEQVRYIMNYNIPLDKYRAIYNLITGYFNAHDANEICKQNLNLLLSNTLENLDQNKANLQSFQPPHKLQIPSSVQKLSKEQMTAVKSTEPLILVQAGAGTGKSTLILGRIDYLIACGVDPQDITVLSFTNAAADNITAKNPNVHSMTIARMIHEIYTANFTQHELSQLDTLMNSLKIYYPTESQDYKTVVYQFITCIENMLRNTPTNFTDMNNFIEAHYDEVIQILDKIHQTSLELEIIICYQKIDTFIEPTSIQSKFLIIDEVQDNSIFEFVYTLKYIAKHKESMFIVGDCSQTLYEFRASNPRALNILESSGTFATYQLNTNYRSNQEILDMANVLLNNIEANQYANIQLRANARAQVTEQSFLEKVHFDYVQLQRINDFHDALPSIFARDVRPYINQCLLRGEQVAILAFTRRDINAIKTILQNQYPNLNPETDIVSLVPNRMYNDTVFSKFICKYWSQIQFAPAANIMQTIGQHIMAKLPYFMHNDQKQAPRVQGMISKWIQEEGSKVQTWYNQVMNAQITQDDFLNFVKENMLEFEIKTNAVKQSLLSARNQENKQSANISTAKFLLSTIHSAKGLEFDNVIVLYKNNNDLEEEKKRMYYVAFTRAMKSEYILAYDTMVSPRIQEDYLTVLKALHATNPAPNSPLNIPSKNRKFKI